MRRFAPRYPVRIFTLIEQLDDERTSLAETARRVGAAAAAEGLIRPSPVHVRRLAGELRRLRAEDREVRKAAVKELTRLLPYAPGNVYEAAAAAAETRARIERRRRREAT